MKIDITKKSLDMDYFKQAIKSEEACGNEIHYIVMNFKTRDEMSYQVEANLKRNEPWKNIYETFDTFYGYPIALCNKLEYGEVDFV